MDDMAKLTQERNQLYFDVYDGKIPKRVPISTKVDTVYACKYCGYDPKVVQWELTQLGDIVDRVAREFGSDICPTGGIITAPLVYHILDGHSYTMSESGLMQHPSSNFAMEVEDYDELIADPFKFIVDKGLPRLYKNLDTTPGERAMVWARAYKARQDVMMKVMPATAAATKKYGLASLPRGGACYAPSDLVSDQLRGFENFVKDIRRIPDKVRAAADAMLPLSLKSGTAPNPTGYGRTFMPLHMPPFLRTKDFEDIWWPSFRKLVDGLVANGMRIGMFCESDWMRFLDYLNDLPKGCLFTFEYGDPKLAKEKVGKKHIINGLYPVSLLQYGTKQECIDKAKELIDILAPGGNYIFSYGKSPLILEDAKMENMIAVNEFVREYAVY